MRRQRARTRKYQCLSESIIPGSIAGRSSAIHPPHGLQSGSVAAWRENKRSQNRRGFRAFCGTGNLRCPLVYNGRRFELRTGGIGSPESQPAAGYSDPYRLKIPFIDGFVAILNSFCRSAGTTMSGAFFPSLIDFSWCWQGTTCHRQYAESSRAEDMTSFGIRKKHRSSF